MLKPLISVDGGAVPVSVQIPSLASDALPRDDRAPAHAALGLSRRSLMNMIVSSAPIAAAMSVGAIASAVALPAAMVGLDDHLLALGRLFEVAWATENESFKVELSDADAEAAMAPARSIVHQIENIPARTLEGLKVKVRAIAWCHGGEEVCILEDPDDATDVRIAGSIVRDLLAMV
jgi:hypothetical protein